MLETSRLASKVKIGDFVQYFPDKASTSNIIDEISIELSFRPCVTLNSNILVSSGAGTINEPYEIKLQKDNGGY